MKLGVLIKLLKEREQLVNRIANLKLYVSTQSYYSLDVLEGTEEKLKELEAQLHNLDREELANVPFEW